MNCNRLCLLVLSTCLVAGCGKSTEEAAVKTESGNPAVVESEASAGEKAEHFLIDVRSQAEWDEGHLETAIHIPHTEIVEGIANVTSDKNAKIFVY